MMIKIFKWWWAWNFEEIEEWLEKMEIGGLRLIETRFDGVVFHFEKCVPAKARYCIDFQTKLTPEYISITRDDGWDLYHMGFGWYVLRKEYQEDRPNLYNNFEGLIARNRFLLKVIIVCSIIEVICFSNMIFNVVRSPSNGHIAYTCIFGSFVLALFSFIITNLARQISKFSKKDKV